MLRKLLALLGDASVYGLSTVLGQVVGFVLIPLYTKFLGPKEYGELAMLAAMMAVCTPIATMGVTNAIFRRYNRTKDLQERRDVLSTGLTNLVASSTILCVVMLCASPLLSENLLSRQLLGQTGGHWLVPLSLIDCAFATIMSAPLSILRADRRVRTLGIINISRVLVGACCAIFLVAHQRLGILGLVLSNALTDAAFLAVLLWLTRASYGFYVRLSIWREMIRYGLPIMPHHLQAVLLGLFGQFYLKEIIGLDQVGLYDMAFRVSAPIGLFVGAINAAWAPYKFQIHADDQNPADFFRTSFTYYIAILGYLWAGVAAWGPEVLRLMVSDPAFLDAAAMVPIIVGVRVIPGIYFMMGSGLELSDDTRPYFLISLTGLITVVVLTLLLAPRWQAEGAAAATMIGWLAMSAVLYRLAQRRFYIPYEWSTIFLMVATTTVCVIGAVAIQSQVPLIRLGFACAVTLLYPTVSVGVLLRSPTERERARMAPAATGYFPFDRWPNPSVMGRRARR